MVDIGPENASNQAGDVEILLNGRFRVFPDQPLPELDSPTAKAYASIDLRQPSRSLFCLVCDPKVPPRRSLISRFKGREHPGLLTPFDEGVVDWAPFGRRTLGQVLIRPVGPRLDPAKPMSVSELINNLLLPAAEILSSLERRGITHRSIRPDNLFWDAAIRKSIILGECASAPPGFNQPVAYETVDHPEAHAMGRGDGTSRDDLYALGVTALALACPESKVRFADEAMLRRKLEQGSLAALTGDIEVPSDIAPVIRGLLSDAPEQRWTADQLRAFLRNERAVTTRPSGPPLMARAFELAGTAHPTMPSLACALPLAKDAALAAIRDGSLAQWLRSTARAEQAAESIEEIRASMDAPGKREGHSAAIARASLLLQPDGPLRFGPLSVMPGGLGTVLYALFAQGQAVTDLLGILETQIPAWLPAARAKSLPGFHGWIDKMYVHLGQRGLGEGAERCLYEMNPEQPCLGEKLDGACVLDLHSLLTTLEANARIADFETSPIDAHVAAFALTHLAEQAAAIPKEVLRNSQSDRPMFELWLLAMVQQSAGKRTAPVLSRWLAHRVAPRLGRLHNRRVRRRLATELEQRQKAGDLRALLQLFEDPRMWSNDVLGFAAAQEQHKINEQAIIDIEESKQPSLAAALANGQELATATSLSVALALTSISLIVLGIG